LFNNRDIRSSLLITTVVLALAAGCGPSPSPSTSTGDASDPATGGSKSISVQLNWYPEVEHGGVFQAVADGSYQEAGLNVEIRPGGRATPIAPELVLGRCQFAITNADDVVLFRAQGADIVAVMATAQNHPRCILVRADSGVEKFEDLQGMTLQRQAGRPFLAFLAHRKLLDGVREVPYHNSVAGMIDDPKMAVQAYVNAEPLLAQQQGLEIRTLMLSDLGWNPYSSVLVTTGDLIRKQPELVAAMTKATRQGWVDYFADPALANASILKANEHGMTQEALAFGVQKMQPLAMPDGDASVLGSMTAERWETLVSQMVEIGVIKPDSVIASECFTTEFLSLSAQ
jgi:NitT/TauT family transport system substrate-binding protein